MPHLPEQPPRLTAWLLERALGPEHAALVGDLTEEYIDHVAAYGRLRAGWMYRSQVLTTLPLLAAQSLIWNSAMLKNYLTIALRNLRKHKGFTSINVFGLAVSMAIALLVILFAKELYTYDRFHPDLDRLYRVTSTVTYPYGTWDMATSPGPLAEVLETDYPMVEETVRLSSFGGLARYDEAAFSLQGLYADPTFFTLFGFELLAGDPETALDQPYAMVLTERTAAKFFGDADPLGQVITRDNIGDFTVTGVIASTQQNTHIKFEALLSMATLEARQQEGRDVQLDNWEVASSYYTYLRLREDTDPEDLVASFPDLMARVYPETAENPTPPALDVQAVAGITTGYDSYSNEISELGNMLQVTILSIMALVVMLIAGFNYVSLATARSLKRAKEIGVRKVAGAHRSQIMRQFLGESILVSLLALVVAVGLLYWLVPAFNSLQLMREIDMQLTFDVTKDGGVYMAFITFAVLVGLSAGLYPAAHLSSFLPVHVLKSASHVRGLSSLTLRKVLVVSQFTLSLILIVITLVIYQQFTLITRADYGLDQEHILQVRLQGVSGEAFEAELERKAPVANVILASNMPIAGGNSSTNIQTEAMAEPTLIQYYAIDTEFLEELHLGVLAGRNFSEAFATDEKGLLLTQAALSALGLGEPHEAIGQVVTFQSQADYTVVGVVDDFYALGYEMGYRPVALTFNPERYYYAIVRLHAGQVEAGLEALEATWATFAPGVTMRYEFFDQRLEEDFVIIRDVIGMTTTVALIAILVACLGLLGMASYSAESRLREVGIRKVLGADVRQIVFLLSSEFIKLLVIAIAVGTPLAWIAGTLFLQQFANRVDLGVWMFALAISAMLLLSLTTIGSQTIRASHANPVDTLRHE